MKVKVLMVSLLLALTACGGGFDTSDVPEGHEIGDSIGTGTGYNGVMRKYAFDWCGKVPFQEDHRKGGEIGLDASIFVMACASKAVTPISVDRKAVCERFEHVVGVSDEFRAFYRKNCGHYEFPGDIAGDGNNEGNFRQRFFDYLRPNKMILLFNAQGEEEDVLNYHEWKAEQDRQQAEKERQREQEKIEHIKSEMEYDSRIIHERGGDHSTYNWNCKPVKMPEIEEDCQRAKAVIDQYKADLEKDKVIREQAYAIADELREISSQHLSGNAFDRAHVEQLCNRYHETRRHLTHRYEYDKLDDRLDSCTELLSN